MVDEFQSISQMRRCQKLETLATIEESIASFVNIGSRDLVSRDVCNFLDHSPSPFGVLDGIEIDSHIVTLRSQILCD